MKYECQRCHHSTIRKCNFLDHINRKKLCSPQYSDISIDEIKEKLEKDCNEKKIHKCEHCDKAFSQSYGLTKHIKAFHVTNTIDSSINHNHSHNNTTNNTHSHNTSISNSHNTTNNHTHNINLTINVLPFGKEKTDHVEANTEFMTNCLKNMTGHGIPELLKEIFCNEDVPENHNVKLKRQHHPSTMKVLVEAANGDKEWKDRDLNKVLEEMINTGTALLVKHNDKLYELIEVKDGDANDTFDMRNIKVGNLRSKKRGVYGPVKNGVFNMVREASQRESI